MVASLWAAIFCCSVVTAADIWLALSAVCSAKCCSTAKRVSMVV
jgi:hypothetical protein